MSAKQRAHPDFPVVTPESFRAKVVGHLNRAIEKTPSKVPHDCFDECMSDMMSELNDLDEYLYGFGYDEREQEQQEQRREQKARAKVMDVDLEKLVMLVDERVQRLLTTLGADQRTQAILAPMDADMLVHAVVRLLDKLPARAFAEDRLIPPGFPSHDDATVAGVIKLMRERTQEDSK